MPKYRKIQLEIEAIMFDGENHDEIVEWSGGVVKTSTVETFNYVFLEVETLEGTMVVNPGEYVIKGVEGEFYPCKPSIFKKTYELIEE